MKNLILCKSFYNDIEQLSTLISSLEYIDCLHGKTIEDFQYVPDQTTDMLSYMLISATIFVMLAGAAHLSEVIITSFNTKSSTDCKSVLLIY